MQSNLKVAITGGIGSGKSTVSGIIARMGYNVLSCDEIYLQLLKDKGFLNLLAVEFGDILNPEGGLDKNKLSEIVFSDKNKLNRLNEITHPQIINKALSRMSVGGIWFCEVPLLFEEGYENLFDKVIVVLRDKSARIASVAQRDNLSLQEVNLRINAQYNYDNSSFEKYYVIHNNLNITYLQAETAKIVEKIVKE